MASQTGGINYGTFVAQRAKLFTPPNFSWLLAV